MRRPGKERCAADLAEYHKPAASAPSATMKPTVHAPLGVSVGLAILVRYISRGAQVLRFRHEA